MPHAIFSTGTQTTTLDVRSTSRQIIPGVEPGGSKVGQPLKPALLITDCWVEAVGFEPDFSVSGRVGFDVFLKLSQEESLNPGFMIPVAMVGLGWVQTAAGFSDTIVHDLFRQHGTVWAPKYVGVHLFEIGVSVVDLHVHLNYEVIEIPWIEWFVKWDFLDHIPDLSGEF